MLERLKEERIRGRVGMTVSVKCIRGLVGSRIGTDPTKRCAAIRAVNRNGVHLKMDRGMV